MCISLNREELITNPGNIVELCLPCHDLTNHSIYRQSKIGEKELKKEKKKVSARKRQRRYKYVCPGVSKNGEPCTRKVRINGKFCHNHIPSKYADEDTCTHVKKNNIRCRRRRLNDFQVCGGCLQWIEKEERVIKL